jgi:sugar phosphate isomerase/epimerase
MSKIPIGLELYSVRYDLANDVRGTLEKVAAMGYDGVEFAGAPQHSAAELRAILDDTGLICCGWHTPLPLVQADTLAATIEFNRILDNDKIIIPGIPTELRQTRADWLKMAGIFNQLAADLAKEGMVTGYHNHHVEFTALEGELPWDTFFGNTVDSVIMQMDNGNALMGGGDPVEMIERYPGRAVTVHLKPYAPSLAREDPHAGFRPLIGEDEIEWEAFFQACETVGGTEWYIVEYESDAYPPLEAVDRSLQNLRTMGK